MTSPIAYLAIVTGLIGAVLSAYNYQHAASLWSGESSRRKWLYVVCVGWFTAVAMSGMICVVKRWCHDETWCVLTWAFALVSCTWAGIRARLNSKRWRAEWRWHSERRFCP